MCVQKAPRILTARSRKKLEQMELMLLTHSPHYRLELHSSTTGVCTRTHARTHTRPGLLVTVWVLCRLTRSSSPLCLNWKSGEQPFTNSPLTVGQQVSSERSYGDAARAGQKETFSGTFSGADVPMQTFCRFSDASSSPPDIETVPPDLLTLTGSCMKLRMTQQPPLRSSNAGTSCPHSMITSHI